ncbi:MAG: MGMT family protein [Chloroflexia bacterium]
MRACPARRVTTYGGLGKALGYPRGARMIGWIMNETPDRQGIPAQRVIAKDGKLSGGWKAFGGEVAMRGLLEGRASPSTTEPRARMKLHEWDPTRDLPDDERARILAEADPTTVQPSVALLRLLNRDPASPFSAGETRLRGSYQCKA